MHDIEGRIKDWTDRVSGGVSPVTTGEVWERSAARKPRRRSEGRRSRRLPLLTAAVVLLALTTTALIVGNQATTEVTTIPGPGSNSEHLGDDVGPRLLPTEFEVAWTDEQGNRLADGLGEPNAPLVINTVRGPDHCGWESAVIMHLGVPLGQEAYDFANSRQYVRDPKQVLPSEGTQGPFVAAVHDLPDDARFSGFRNGEIELWVAPSTFEEVVYVGRNGRFEAWPREAEGVACG